MYHIFFIHSSVDGHLVASMDGPRDLHTEWSKSDTEKQISYDIAYMWNLKKGVQMNLFTKEK